LPSSGQKISYFQRWLYKSKAKFNLQHLYSMKFFFKCFAIFLGLSVALILLAVYVLHIDLKFNGIVLYSGVISLAVTLIYGWLDDVVIHQRQPELDEKR